MAYNQCDRRLSLVFCLLLLLSLSCVINSNKKNMKHSDGRMTSARDTNLLIGFKRLLRTYGLGDTVHELLPLFLAGEKGKALEFLYGFSLLFCNSFLLTSTHCYRIWYLIYINAATGFASLPIIL